MDFPNSYIHGNDFDRFVVNSTTFEQIEELEDFKADSSSNSSVCNEGQWRIAHGTAFCVTDTVAPGTPSVFFNSCLPDIYRLAR
jgi:hypothetical protein